MPCQELVGQCQTVRSRIGKNPDSRCDILHAMSVIPITVFFSLLLAAFFVVMFLREQRRHRFASVERDSLLPLAEERPAAPSHSPAIAVSPDAPAPGDLYF